MSKIHTGDFQTLTWNSQTFTILIDEGGTTPPEISLDDPVRVTTGAHGNTHGQVAGARASVGVFTAVCAFDEAYLGLTMGGYSSSDTSSIVLVGKDDAGADLTLTIPDMRLSKITPGGLQGNTPATITLEFQRNDPAGTSAYITAS